MVSAQPGVSLDLEEGALRLSRIIPIGMVALILVACGSGSGQTGSGLTGQIEIGGPLPLTGPAAFAGTLEQEGMQLAVDEVNTTGFLGAAKLHASYVDVGATPQQAVTVARQMIDQDKVAALTGLASASQAPAVAAVAQAGKTPFIVVEGGAPGVSSTGDYITQTNLQQFTYADKMGKALKQLNVTTTEILYAQDNGTIATLVHTYTDQIFPKYGIKPTLKAYVGTDTDLSAGVTQGLAAKVDAIGCLFIGAQGTTCLSQARSAGFTGQMWGQAGFDGGVAVKAGSVADKLVFTAAFSPDFPYPSSKKFVSLYASKHPDKVPTAFQAEGYDAIWLIARAAKEGGGTTREAIHTGMLKVLAKGMDGALGPETWDKDRQLLAPGAVIQIKDGKPTLLL
jgi:branched-chain amino acid transport system substrate-binding protein